MADYKDMYTKLFNAVTDAVDILQQAQIETEKVFISQKENNITVLQRTNKKDKE